MRHEVGITSPICLTRNQSEPAGDVSQVRLDSRTKLLNPKFYEAPCTFGWTDIVCNYVVSLEGKLRLSISK